MAEQDVSAVRRMIRLLHRRRDRQRRALAGQPTIKLATLTLMLPPPRPLPLPLARPSLPPARPPMPGPPLAPAEVRRPMLQSVQLHAELEAAWREEARRRPGMCVYPPLVADPTSASGGAR